MKNLKQYFVKLFILLIGSLFLFSSCDAIKGEFPNTVETEVENATNKGFDGIIVCVNQGGEIKHYGAGWKNRENKIPVDTQSLFKIASISKLYITAATVKLIVNQSLSLDQTLAELMPELKDRIENADEISLRMLLQHRSGIPNFTDHSDFPWDYLPISNQQALELVLDESADFEADRRYKYSNTNYLLIGEILDKTLGYSHHQYIKEEILLPLDLHNTYSLLSEVAPEDVMSGYHKGWDPDVKLNDYTMPGGSMVATAADVTVFLRALIDGSLLSAEEQEVYTSVYPYEHTGLLPGYQSIARYHEELDAVVVQFTGNSGGNAWMKSERIYKKVVKALEN